jgi:hypothetical protein
MNDTGHTVDTCLKNIFQLTSMNLAKKSKGKALVKIRDFTVVAMQLTTEEKIANSADLAATMVALEAALELVSNHCEASIVNDFEKNYTNKLQTGELQKEVLEGKFSAVKPVLAPEAANDKSG